MCASASRWNTRPLDSTLTNLMSLVKTFQQRRKGNIAFLLHSRFADESTLIQTTCIAVHFDVIKCCIIWRFCQILPITPSHSLFHFSLSAPPHPPKAFYSSTPNAWLCSWRCYNLVEQFTISVFMQRIHILTHRQAHLSHTFRLCGCELQI